MARFTRLLIGANVAVFVLEAISGPGLLATFALWPVGHFIVAQFENPVGFKLWQLITCGFLHGRYNISALRQAMRTRAFPLISKNSNPASKNNTRSPSGAD